MNGVNHSRNTGRLTRILSWAYALSFPFLLFLLAEELNTGGGAFFPSVMKDLPLLFISGGAVLLAMGLLYCLWGNVFLSGLVSGIVLLFFYIVNYYRYKITGWVFVPADLTLTKQLNTILNFANLEITFRVKVTAALFIVILIPLFFASKGVKVDLRQRMAGFSCLLAMGLFLFLTDFSRNYVLPRFNLDWRVRLSTNQLYSKKGVLSGFYISYFYFRGQQPSNYSQARTEEIIKGLKENLIPNEKKLDFQPNVVVVMSEAFSDPTLWSNINFSQDPIPYFRGLSEKYTSGKLISPAFGGGTCNPEYEFLTGNAYVFSGYAAAPFEQYERFIPGDMPRSLPNMFRANGYHTVGIHTFNGDFFNRNIVYPRLGFDKFLALEDMEDPVYEGPYVSDGYFASQIIDQLDQAEEPVFIFGVSMENHYSYESSKYPANPIKADSPVISGYLLEEAETYAHGIRDADKALKKLIDYVEKSEEPTIVVFFGDHLPLIGSSAFELYSSLGYIGSGSTADFSTDDNLKMFSTSYVVWDNFSGEKENWGNVSPYFLGGLTAQQAGIDMNLYYHFLLRRWEDYHAFKENLFVDKNDGIFSAPRTPEDIEASELFRYIQFDSVFGKGYANGEMSKIMKK